jgi:hypothetical protein
VTCWTRPGAVFGRGEGGTTVHANQALVVTTEQLEQIRQLPGATVHEAPQLEGPPHADAHRDNGKSFVTRADEKLTAFVGT